MSEEREKALLNFINLDEELIQLNKINPVFPIELKPETAIILIGYIPNNSIRFSLNLVCKPTGNIAFHFNPRLDRGYIVRNSKVKNRWQQEETSSSGILPKKLFLPNLYFHLVIFCTTQEFHVAVNGHHFCSFPYRLPLESITQFEYDGDVEDVRIRITNLSVYPDSRITKTPCNFTLTDQQPLVENLEVPLSVSICPKLNRGGKILLKGRLKLLPYAFAINLQKSCLIYPHPEIALHLNPRFHYGHLKPCVVMNCWTEGAWSQEERHEGQLSWAPGRDFELTIHCEYEGYNIWLGDKMIGEFQHRMEPSIVDTLQVTGDLILYEVSLSFND